MRTPILGTKETVIARGHCSDLRLFIIQSPEGFRYAALSGKTNIGTFSCFKDAADARDALVAHVRGFKPKAAFRFF